MRRIIFKGCEDIQVTYGGHDDPRELLTIGEVYDLEQEEINNWYTRFKLKDILGKFNSVCFEDLGESGDTPIETINHYRSLTI